uniref:Cytochrome c assembly protein domain-containing protein n=1 Tax=Musa acuminata subsp. malaccensis TaxID=214687 RepID=A0A804L815_MUSAM
MLIRLPSCLFPMLVPSAMPHCKTLFCGGFPFLTIGILCGAVWANEAWGSYWNWDPKDTLAFLTFTIFYIYSHTHTRRINLLRIGLHSYGSFTLTST